MTEHNDEPRIAVDPVALEGLRRFGGDALLRQIVMLFRDQVSIRMAAMHKAVDEKDPTAARQASHALKSSAGQIGATGMQELCQMVERAALDGNMDAVTTLVPQLDAAIPVVEMWLTDRGFPREN